MADRPRFITDENVGKLGRYLRRLGFDTASFRGGEDREMVKQALAEVRIVLTRDTHIEKYGVAANGRVKVITFATDSAEEQLKQVTDILGLAEKELPFTLCLECNQPLAVKHKSEVAERVPPHILETQEHYVECPSCRRVYWRGSHWQAMREQMEAMRD